VEIERRVVLAAPAATVYRRIDDLAHYPTWMELVHDVDVAEPDSPDRPAWNVELRAQVGPLARSKRLRMVRTVHDVARRVVFERAEIDGRDHAAWVLEGQLTPSDAGHTELTMTLRYGGNLWTGAVLQRVLDDHVERGAAALAATFGDGP
jgi:uncharacterized membrane protein